MSKLYNAILFVFLLSNLSYGQNWIPYQEYRLPVNQVNNFYYTNTIVQPQPILVYQLTPITYYHNIIVEQRFLCRTTQSVVAQPMVYWVYTPIVIYR